MREIKFRAWFKGNEKHKPAFITGFNMVNFHEYYNEGLEPTIYRYSTEWKLSEINLLQFTGLKDKNGVDIYEGDICICNGSNTIFSCPYGGPHRFYTDEKIFITNELCGFCGRHISSFGKNFSPSSFFLGWETISNYNLWNNQKGLTIIGNIYQHPELLK